MSPRDALSYPADAASPRYWPIWIGIFLLRVLCLLPYSWLVRLGSGLGWLFFKLSAARRRIAEINLELCFPQLPPQQRQALLRANIRDTGIGIMETLYAFWGRHPPQTIVWHGEEILHEALAQKRGVLLVGLHMTCLEIIGRLINQRYRMDYLWQEQRNPVLRTAMLIARSRYFDQAIDRKAIRHLLKRLRQGHIVWYAPDQDHGTDHGVFSSFFGVEAATITALDRLASLNHSPVVFIRYHRLAPGAGYAITFERADGFPSGDEHRDARRINDFLEQAIRPHPEQYLWVHRKFKTRPAGVPERYQRQDGHRYGD